jgi:uncharacterized NAD-dependent epimerase/dehydratase family protein
MLGRRRRLALLAEGHFTLENAKTAVGVLRYRADQVAAVIDSTSAGRTVQEAVGIAASAPVVADLEAAAALGADSLLLGIAPQGGALPETWRAMVRDALRRGWDVLSGLHEFLADDAELAALARASGATLIDVRRPPRERTVGTAAAARTRALVVLTVGTDCNVGKMTAALEIERALASAGVRAAFVATGQTGIFIADRGTAVDAIPADFVAGAVEELVVEAAAEAEVVLVEGQGSLFHPGYSGVTLGLLHGAAPEALVLCHQPTRDRIRLTGSSVPGSPIPALSLVRDAYERAASWVRPARVMGVALNTAAMAESAARAAVSAAAAELHVPATDPVRFGAAPIAEALRRMHEERRLEARAAHSS